MGKHVMITGATGMIGGLVLQLCLDNQEVETVVSLVRRPSGIHHDKLRETIVDEFLKLDEAADYWQGLDAVFYCLGVYTGAVDRETFRTIMVDYPEALGRMVERHSPNAGFCLLSGAGADRTERSRMMFAEDKGAIENRLTKMALTLHAFRPGYIYPVTPRAEPNFSYKLWRWLYPLIRLMGDGASIKSTELAQAMVKVGLHGSEQEIFENRDIGRM